MNNFLRKISVLLIGVMVSSVLFVSCKATEDVKKSATEVTEGVKKGAKEVTEGVKKGAEDVKKGVEDITDKGNIDKIKESLIGTWKGKEANGDKYTITFYKDSSYEIVEQNKNGKEKAVYSGKYIVEGDKLTLNREKEKKNGKVVDKKETTTITYTLEDNKKITFKSEGKVDMVLNKESTILDKIIK